MSSTKPTSLSSTTIVEQQLVEKKGELKVELQEAETRLDKAEEKLEKTKTELEKSEAKLAETEQILINEKKSETGNKDY